MIGTQTYIVRSSDPSDESFCFMFEPNKKANKIVRRTETENQNEEKIGQSTPPSVG